ncbi:MAG: hypothetical protein JW822_02210, partial [Spirochaetales bacterium]|nr:hypothetical protein [Spirochaetales bacterium]
MDLKSIIVIVGLCIGSFTLLAVVIVYFKQKSVGNGGVLLAVLGVILIGGLSVWHQISIELPGDIKIVISGLKQEYQELSDEVSSINAENKSVLKSLATLEVELQKPFLDKSKVFIVVRSLYPTLSVRYKHILVHTVSPCKA